MGVVDQQPGVVVAAHRGQLRQWRDVAVHAEHAVGRDQRVALGARELVGERGRVGMPVAQQLGAAEPCAIDQRGVVQAVLHDAVAAPGERGDGTEVGHVAGREEQRALAPGEGGQLLLEGVVLGMVAADQVRGATAAAAAVRGVGKRRGDPRVASQAEVVVAAEREQPTAVDLELGTARAGDDASAAVEALGAPAVECRGESAHAVSAAVGWLAQALP